MATLVIMPRQGQSVESCVITTWEKKVGDKISEGDTLFSYETDKSSFEEKATVSGTLLAVFAGEGDDVPCLNPVCVIGNEGEDYSALVSGSVDAATVSAKIESGADTTAKEASVPAAANTVTAEAADGKLKISPRAKNLAARTEADLSKAVPTGPHGRIIERDVSSLLDQGFVIKPAAAQAVETKAEEKKTEALKADEKKTEAPKIEVSASGYTDVKLSNIRKVIAKSMHASLSSMAQLTLNSSFDAAQLIQYRAAVKANGEKLGLENITLNDMVLYAVAKTLASGVYKDINAHYLEAEGIIRYFSDVNLGIAVDTERGLMVPTLAEAQKLSLSALAKASKTLIKETQAGTLSPDKLRGASFTVTNLGSLGVESFTPVINPPQTAILGVNTLMRRVKEVDGRDVFYTAMGLSLTFDHRALDGAPAAKFLKDLCANLENFNMLLAK